MYKKLIIIASVLLVAGGATLTWALDQRRKDREEIADYQSKYTTQADDFVRQYNEWLQMPPQERTELPLLLDEDGKTKTREQLRREQQGRFKANVDKLVSGVVTNPSLADILYGENWRAELSVYKKRQAVNRFALTGSIVCTSAGGVVYAALLLHVVVRLIAKAASGLKGLVGRSRSADEEDTDKEPEAEGAEDTKPEPADETDSKQKKPEPRPRIPVKPMVPATAQREYRTMGSLTQRPKTSREREKSTALLTDDKSVVEAPAGREPVRLDVNEVPKPIDNTLNDLTEQVSAIREYAANQQDRLEKLQDGYDWNIIKTFCLRVIRCVDNLDSRITKLANKKAQRTHLEEVRDELIFALESSGIEQFEPDTDTEYRGQEKFAEAVKEKMACDDPEQAGKIAEVIRPGYQYFIDDENVKIVRPAQVKLYA